MKYFGMILRERIIRGKTGVFLILNFILMDVYLSPLRDFAQDVHYGVELGVEAFLLSDVYYLSIFIFSILYFFSDIPFFGKSQMFYMIRLGRKRWTLYNIFYILLMGMILFLMETAMCMVIMWPVLNLGNDWGKVLGTLSMTDAGMQTQQMIVIYYGTLLKFSPWELLGITAVLSSLILAFLGLIMYAASLLFSRAIAAVIGAILAVLPGIANYFYEFPWNYISPVSWMRTAFFESGSIMIMPSVPYMLIVVIVGIILISIVVIIKMKNKDIQWIADNQER